MSLPSLFNMDDGPPADGDAPSPSEPAGEARPAVAGSLMAAAAQTRSLYRKYRPQSFDATELVGQEHVVRTLRNAILLGRVAHAYLFCGPRGTGKTTTARLLAKAVNCLDPDPMNRPCNACDNCRAIARNATTDVIEIDAASNRGIDDIRDLRERVKYAPTQLTTKFYIIDEAHQITGAAANAFLKTLEEPPPHTKFVLATTDPEELLATIVSRCQRFDFRRINLESMTDRLRTVASAEGLSVDDDALAVIARQATGSLRDALGLLDQLAVYREVEPDGTAVNITAVAVRAVLGVSRNDRVTALARALADRDARLALETVNSAVEAGEDPRQLNRQLVAYLRILLHERAGGSPDADDEAKALAGRFDLLELAQLARRFSEIDYRIRHSSYNQLPLEVALVESVLDTPSDRAAKGATAQPDQPASAKQDVKAPERVAMTTLRDRVRRPASESAQPARTSPPETTQEQPAPAPQQEPRTVSETPTTFGDQISVEKLVDLWPRIRGDVKAVNRQIEAVLQCADPFAVQGDLITLASPYPFHRNRLNTDEFREVVENVISRIVQGRVRITCILRGEEAPASPVAKIEPSVVAPLPSPVPASPNGSNVDPPTPPTSGEAGSEPGEDPDELRLKAAKNIFDAEEIVG
ncbi:MAG: DNA polymerase III subunit gamma/tau [Thermomicrobiales bacterium]